MNHLLAPSIHQTTPDSEQTEVLVSVKEDVESGEPKNLTKLEGVAKLNFFSWSGQVEEDAGM